MKIKVYEICLIAFALAAVFFSIGFFTGKDAVNAGEVIINTASFSEDAMKEPEKENADTGISDAPGNETGAKKVNINTAPPETLMTLPGVGAVLAERIITYRDEIGGFDTIEEILNVYGIGETIYNDIVDLITTE